MPLLALDGSLARASAAVLDGERLLARAAAEGARGHPQTLPALAERVLVEAGLSATALDAVAVVVGPGGFTGLRATLALAEGIALGAGLALIGVTTGEALAAALPEALRQERAVWTAVDNKRGRVVLERFALGAATPEDAPRSMDEADLPAPAGPVALAGDAAGLVAARLLARGFDAMLTDIRLPDAADVARIGLLRLAGRIPPREAVPLYSEPPSVRP